MQTIIFATGNEGKMREVRAILAREGWQVLSMKEAGIFADPEENGKTFEENAIIKVKALRPLTDAIVMADDSGLEIDAFGGEPGVHSARWLGHDTSYEIKNQEILNRMKDVKGKDRGARYVAAIAVALPDGSVYTTRGVMEGVIGEKAAGNGGFGYDPVLYLPEYGQTVAEISAELKNQISHRGKALEEMKELLEKLGVFA